MTAIRSERRLADTTVHRASGLLTGYLGALILVTVVFLAGHRALILGQAVPLWDASSFYAPAQILVADAARAGRLILWNPWVAGGLPEAADPQVGALSPLNVLFGAVFGANLRSFTAFWLLIWWLGGAAVILLARHLGAPPWGAAVAALGLIASGSFIGHAQHTSFQLSLSALPFLIWRLDAALVSGRRGPALQAGAIWGLSALHGYPALTILNAGYLTLWAFGRWAFGGRQPGGEGHPRPSAARTVAVLGLLFVVGVLVLAPTWAAFFLEGRGYSDRAGPLPRAVAVTSNALHPAALASWASPYVAVLGLLDPTLFGDNVASSATLYLPATVVVLALVGWVVRPGRWRIWLAVITLLALGTALGRSLPLRGWLYDLLPPMRYFRHAAVFRSYSLFTVVVLALYASRDLHLRSRLAGFGRRAAAVGGCVTLAAFATLAAVLARVEIPAPNLPLAVAMACGLWSAAACLVAAASRGNKVGTAVVTALLALTAADAWSTLRLSRHFVVAVDEPSRRIWKETMAHHHPSLDLTDSVRQLRSRFGTDSNNRNEVAKEPVLDSYVPLGNRFYFDWISQPRLRDAAVGSERLWFVPSAPEVPWTPQAMRRFLARSSELEGMPVVLHRRASVLQGLQPEHPPAELDDRVFEALRPARRAEAEIVRYEPQLMELAVEAPSGGLLLVTDRFARGWRAHVNGVSREVQPANFLFRAVPLPAGLSQVQMSYRPAGHPWLLILSWTTLLGIALHSALRLRRSPSSGSDPAQAEART